MASVDLRHAYYSVPIKAEYRKYLKLKWNVGEWGWGVEGKQVGSMDEEQRVRGCYNITFICTQPARKQCLYWKRHKQTKHLEHESTCKV